MSSDRAEPKLVIDDVSASEVADVVEPLFREYGAWVAARLLNDRGITFTDADLTRHHDSFRDELPGLLGPRGRLLVARVDREPVGVGAFKPADDTTTEIKRMFVRPAARGSGVGSALLRASSTRRAPSAMRRPGSRPSGS